MHQLFGKIRDITRDRDGSLTWPARLAIMLFFFSAGAIITLCYADNLIGFILFYSPYLDGEKGVFSSTVTLAMFGLILGFGNWVIKNEDVKKQFKDTFAEENELTFSNAVRSIFTKSGDNTINIHGFKEIVRLAEKGLIDKERINVVTKSSHDLGKADLDGITLADLDLRSIQLQEASIKKSNLRKTKLSEANLVQAVISDSDLNGAKLINADLRNSDLKNSKLIDSDLSGANLDGADLRGCNLNNAKLGEAKLSGANLGGAKLNKAKLPKTDLSGAKLSNTDFSRADLGDANLLEADLSGANLSKSSLKGGNLLRADLRNTDLRNSKASLINCQNFAKG